jgi:hypothetical protein
MGSIAESTEESAMASADSLAGLQKWVRREEWREAFAETFDLHLGEACADAGIAFDRLAEVIGDHHATIAWACAFEDFLTRDLDDGRNVADDYLKRRGWNESVANKAYIAGLRSSVMSLYEISDIVVDQSFLARDLVRGGEPVRVSEKSATHYLKPWDRIAARIVQVGSRTEMAGGALPFSREASEVLLEALDDARKDARKETRKIIREVGLKADDAQAATALAETEFLRLTAFLFTDVWLDDFLHRTLDPQMPQLCNTDGDDIAFTTVRFPLNAVVTAEGVRRALAKVSDLRPADEFFWNWLGPIAAAGHSRRLDRQALATTMDDGTPVLGTVELKGRTLALEANSPQRAERGRAMLAAALQGMTGDPLVVSGGADDMEAAATAKSANSLPRVSPEEAREVVQAFMHRHYTDALDQPVPMLGNKTPRQAAKSAKGREKVAEWLKFLENGNAKQDDGSPMAGYDVSWMWQELGVAALRR